MKRSRGKRRPSGGFLARLRASARSFLTPRRCLPCVGLVVVGGCLTLMVMPDDQSAAHQEKAAAEAAARGEMPTVVVDPGHGGKDEGTKWRGVSEKDLTLEVATRIESLLRQSGFPTVMTRRENTYVSLEERARVANRLSNALFISIHFNSDPTGNSSGIETFYARQKEPPDAAWTWVGLFNRPEASEAPDTSEVLAGEVQSALGSRTESRNRGIHPANFYVVHHTRCPAILVEGGFLSNVFESQMLAYPQYQETLAQGVVEGVLRFQKLRAQPGGIIPPPRLARLAP